MSTESERIAALEKGFKDAQAAAEANFDPMKGRTYIARMSPAMKRMLVEAIKKARVKREERRKAKRNEQSPVPEELTSLSAPKNNLKKPGLYGREEIGDMESAATRSAGLIDRSLPERELQFGSGTIRDDIEGMSSLSAPRNTLEERDIRGSNSRVEYNPSRRDRRRSERGRREAREEQARYEAELDASLREDFPDLDLREEKAIRDRKLAQRLGLIVPTSDPVTSESIPGMGKEVDLSRVVESRPRKKRTAKQTMREYRKRLREEQEKELLRDYNYGGKILKKYRR